MSVGAIAVAEAEDYLDRAQLAKRMGVSVDTIDRWRKAGMPSETWGMRKRVFRPSLCIAWRRRETHAEQADAGDLAA